MDWDNFGPKNILKLCYLRLRLLRDWDHKQVRKILCLVWLNVPGLFLYQQHKFCNKIYNRFSLELNQELVELYNQYYLARKKFELCHSAKRCFHLNNNYKIKH